MELQADSKDVPWLKPPVPLRSTLTQSQVSTAADGYTVMRSPHDYESDPANKSPPQQQAAQPEELEYDSNVASGIDRRIPSASYAVYREDIGDDQPSGQAQARAMYEVMPEGDLFPGAASSSSGVVSMSRAASARLPGGRPPVPTPGNSVWPGKQGYTGVPLTELEGDDQYMGIRPPRLFQLELRYLRSLEGIFRLFQLPFALVGLVVAWVYMPTTVSNGELWYVAVGMAYSTYIVLVVCIETLLAHVYVHRLVDGIITALFAAAWLTAGIATTFDLQMFDRKELGASAALAYLLMILTALSSILSFHTWRTYRGGKAGSYPMSCF